MTAYEPGSTSIPRCPICGSYVEAGCLYAADNKPLQWIAGDPGWRKNVTASFGDGTQVGEFTLLAGTYARGIFCQKCNKIILDYQPKPDYYSDVK